MDAGWTGAKLKRGPRLSQAELRALGTLEFVKAPWDVEQTTRVLTIMLASEY